MDILADPDNPEYWPLKIEIFKSELRERKTKPHPHENGLLCKFFCNKKEEYLVSDPLGKNEKTLTQDKLREIATIDQCYECIKEEIIDGIIYHNREEKLKWFIIDREIPVMFPADLRDIKQENEFIANYTDECTKLNIDKTG
jgi:uncharacterized protein YbaR (Trm112 family)